MADDATGVEDFEPEDQERIRRARLELVVEDELQNSAVVRLIRERASHEMLRALDEIVEADAGDTNRIRELQATIRRHRDIEGWIGEALDQGKEARRQIDAAGQPE